MAVISITLFGEHGDFVGVCKQAYPGYSARCLVTYRGKQVGKICRSFDSQAAGNQWLREMAAKFAAGFNPNKRTSSDDLDWWSRWE